MDGNGVSESQAGVLCGGGIRVDNAGREFRPVFRQEHVLPHAMFVGSCWEMCSEREVAGMADGGELRPLYGASIFHAFSGQHPLVRDIGYRIGRHVLVALGVRHVRMSGRRGGSEEILIPHG